MAQSGTSTSNIGTQFAWFNRFVDDASIVRNVNGKWSLTDAYASGAGLDASQTFDSRDELITYILQHYNAMTRAA